jgi:hypothetical protein
MKKKQLADVLIKILGLSVVVNAIPSLVSGLVGMMKVPEGFDSSFGYYAVGSVVTAIIGISLIFQSRVVVEYLFKEDDE